MHYKSSAFPRNQITQIIRGTVFFGDIKMHAHKLCSANYKTTKNYNTLQCSRNLIGADKARRNGSFYCEFQTKNCLKVWVGIKRGYGRTDADGRTKNRLRMVKKN
jgi:hypothetical protein